MAEKIAEIEVELEINDREYAQGAQHATKETQKLAESARQLDGDLKHTQTSASKAGTELDKMGTQADKTRKIIEKLRGQLGGGQLIGGIAGGLGFGGVMSVGGALASLVGTAAGASEANANAMMPFGLASGGNTATYSAMSDLYRKINQSNTIQPQSAATIAKQITTQFGWMAPAERESLASQIANMGEIGEDTSSFIKSLSQIAKHQGMEYGLGQYTMPDLLGRIAYTASQTGDTMSNVAAGMSTILQQSGPKSGVRPGDAMEMLIAGHQMYGADTFGSTARALHGLEKSKEPRTVWNEDFRNLHPSVTDQIFASEFPRYWRSPPGYVSLDQDTLLPSEGQRKRRDRDLFGKNVATGLGNGLDWILDNTVFREPAPVKIEQDYAAWRKLLGQDRNMTINMHFAADTNPSVEIEKARKREAARAASQVY